MSRLDVCSWCSNFMFTIRICQSCERAFCPDCLSVNGYCSSCVDVEFPDMPYVSYYDYDREEWEE